MMESRAGVVRIAIEPFGSGADMQHTVVPDESDLTSVPGLRAPGGSAFSTFAFSAGLIEATSGHAAESQTADTPIAGSATDPAIEGSSDQAALDHTFDSTPVGAASLANPGDGLGSGHVLANEGSFWFDDRGAVWVSDSPVVDDSASSTTTSVALLADASSNGSNLLDDLSYSSSFQDGATVYVNADLASAHDSRADTIPAIGETRPFDILNGTTSTIDITNTLPLFNIALSYQTSDPPIAVSQPQSLTPALAPAALLRRKSSRPLMIAAYTSTAPASGSACCRIASTTCMARRRTKQMEHYRPPLI
jgi:hypothetical protein